MGSPNFVKTIIKKTFSSRFFLSRLSHYPMVGKLIDVLLFENDDVMYLPKDSVIPVNQQLTRESDTVLPSQILETLIRRANHHWIMNFCICRESSQCKDYPTELGCIFMGEAAMNINPQWGRPVSAEEALAHAHRCREAGLVHLVGRNKLDSVWLSARPANKLLTVCNCCPCCCLWRILPEITPNIGDKVHRMPGINVAVSENCIGCGTCTEGVCFVGAIEMNAGRAKIGENCRGCGRCIEVCPNNAIEMKITDDEFADHALQRLYDAVDLN
jgi:ferredoxin